MQIWQARCKMREGESHPICMNMQMGCQIPQEGGVEWIRVVNWNYNGILLKTRKI